jgi:hypothetical protein
MSLEPVVRNELETSEKYASNILKCKTDDDIASDLIVAVMTVCGQLGTNINLLKIFDLYMEGKCDPNFELNYVPNSKKTRDGKKNKAFYNCLSVLFYIKDADGIESKIASKIFPNGSIQLPGCRTMDAVTKSPQVLNNFIRDLVVTYPDIIDGTLNLSGIRIVMINSNFIFQTKTDGTKKQVGIIQERLKDIINANKFEGVDDDVRKWRMATYQPEKYAGVNIRYWTKNARRDYAHYFTENKKLPKKIEGQISIFVFRSGKGTITAAKNSEDLLDAYRAICQLVRDNKKTVLISN